MKNKQFWQAKDGYYLDEETDYLYNAFYLDQEEDPTVDDQIDALKEWDVVH
jgi:hypothetical protein